MMQVKNRYADSDGNIDENQLADDLSLYLDEVVGDDVREEKYRRILNGIVNEFRKRIDYEKELPQESIFYDGLVAETENHKVEATGEVRIVDRETGLIVYNGKEQNEGVKGGLETDKDLKRVRESDRYEIVNNNWFSIHPKNDRNNCRIRHRLDEALELMENLEAKRNTDTQNKANPRVEP